MQTIALVFSFNLSFGLYVYCSEYCCKACCFFSKTKIIKLVFERGRQVKTLWEE